MRVCVCEGVSVCVCVCVCVCLSVSVYTYYLWTMMLSTFAKEVVKLCYCSNRKWCLSPDVIDAEPAKSSDQEGEVWVGV